MLQRITRFCDNFVPIVILAVFVRRVLQAFRYSVLRALLFAKTHHKEQSTSKSVIIENNSRLYAAITENPCTFSN